MIRCFVLAIIAIFSKNEQYNLCLSAAEAFSNINTSSLSRRTQSMQKFRHTGNKASAYNRVKTNTFEISDDDDSFHNEQHQSSALTLKSTPTGQGQKAKAARLAPKGQRQATDAKMLKPRDQSP